MKDHKGDSIANHWLTKHGHRTSKSTSSEYKSWICMKSRCLNKNNDNYENYGGRGISVCESWINNFNQFLSDMGPKPCESYTIERVDFNGDYTPENCIWASRKEQSRNKRTNILTEIDGLKLTLADISEKYGVPKTTIYRRYKQGYRGGDLVSKDNKNKGKLLESKSCSVSVEDVNKMKEMRGKGSTYSRIASEFKVSYATAYKWVNIKGNNYE